VATQLPLIYPFGVAKADELGKVMILPPPQKVELHLAATQSLDVPRGVAILSVFGRHPPYSVWTRAGWIGVDLFFVIPGFLISGLLFSEYKATDAISFKRFFIRRGFRIYPLYYSFLLLTRPFTIGRLTWSDLTFMQSHFTGFGVTVGRCPLKGTSYNPAALTNAVPVPEPPL
jgi:peptidoglycan/LPS O-acetylase OafA/YrhL